jgi:Domain of unknown function (DUF4149)
LAEFGIIDMKTPPLNTSGLTMLQLNLSHPTIAPQETQTWQNSSWHRILPLALAFWVSASLLLDFLVMPVLYQSGMMTESNFVLAGQSLFGSFNRVELLLGAVVLVGFLIKQQAPLLERESMGRNLPIALLLFGIAALYTYALTPAMTSIGFDAEVTGIIPTQMDTLHYVYWGLEALKITALSLLFSREFRLFR